MRAVIYTRVSQDDGSARSVSEQEWECREFCADQGWEVDRVLTDNDRGASRWSVGERPAYRELKEVLKPSDILVTWESSRAQRDLGAFVELRDLCAAIGVKWAYTGRVYDLADGNDRYITGMDALNAEREAEIIRARVLRGKRAAATAGRPGSKVPPGFRVVRDERTGKPMTWEPSELAPVMQEAARRILEGEPLREVARWTNENGVDGSHTRLRERLKMASYAGLRVYQGEILREANWEGLWSPDVRNRLIAELERRARTSGRGGGNAPKHLVAGIAKCGVCGAGMRHYWPPSAQKVSAPPSYVCMNGMHVRRRADRIEAMVEETVLAILRGMDPNAVFSSGDDSEAEEHWAEARALQERLDGFIEAAAEPGGLSPRALAKVEAKLLPQIAAAAARARDAAKHQNPIVAQLVENPDEWFERTVVDKREVIRALIEMVEVRPTQQRGMGDFVDEDVVITPF